MLLGIPFLFIIAHSIGTHIRTDFAVDKLAFTIGEIEEPFILSSINYQSVDIYKFEKVQFYAKRITQKNTNEMVGENLIQITPTVDGGNFSKVRLSSLHENKFGKTQC